MSDLPVQAGNLGVNEPISLSMSLVPFEETQFSLRRTSISKEEEKAVVVDSVELDSTQQSARALLPKLLRMKPLL